MTRVMRAERYMVVVMRGRKVCVGKAKIWGGGGTTELRRFAWAQQRARSGGECAVYLLEEE